MVLKNRDLAASPTWRSFFGDLTLNGLRLRGRPCVKDVYAIAKQNLVAGAIQVSYRQGAFAIPPQIPDMRLLAFPQQSIQRWRCPAGGKGREAAFCCCASATSNMLARIVIIAGTTPRMYRQRGSGIRWS